MMINTVNTSLAVDELVTSCFSANSRTDILCGTPLRYLYPPKPAKYHQDSEKNPIKT